MAPYPLLSRFLAPGGCAEHEPLSRRVSGKVVLVTGASFGIGHALAQRLGKSGATVLLAARSATELQALREQILAQGGEAYGYPLDLRDPEEVDAVAQDILARHQRVDIVVHNAGKSIRRSIYRSLDRAHDFERTMGVNYLGPVRLQLALLPSMIARGEGQIVNVSSVGVRLPAAAYWGAYTASKSAFDLWIRCAAPELRHRGITCTRVYFGLVHTAMSAPTKAYASMPGLTADQAACVLARALIEKPASVAPWWLEPLHWLSIPLEPVFDWWQYRFGPVDPEYRRR